jgi:hypothetical protein
MKYIRLYNESKASILEELIDYTIGCFSEFSDDDKFQTEFDLEFDDRFMIMINIPNLNEPYKGKDISEFINWSASLNSLFLDIHVAINRVKDKYKDIEVNIRIYFIVI